MFVSFLQRLGFKSMPAPAVPIQSRADQDRRDDKPAGEAGDREALAHAGQSVAPPAMPGKQARPAAPAAAQVPADIQRTQRRPPVTAPAKKTAASDKTVAGAKAAVQPALKTPKKSAVGAQKTAVSGENPRAPSPTVAPKSSAMAKSPETAAVTSPKKATSAAPKKSLPKAALPAAPAEPAKASTVAAAKPPAKPSKPAPTDTVKAPAASQPAASGAGAKPVLPAAAPASRPAPHSPERSTSMTSAPALKPGRRSSARAPSQLPPPAPMVPTHAPDAAKASYGAMTERVIAPPPHVAAKKDPKLANNWKTTPGEALSDEEVKAMPDSEYMNDKQMAFFRHKLSVLKQEIHNSAGQTTEHLREDTVVVPDPADRATIEEEHALELRTRDRERKLLKKIEQSIARIDSGDYGYCDETGEPIGVGRLIARPTANLSLEAQQRRELKQKMFGD